MRKKKVESEVMRCSRYGNWDRMHVILKGEPLEEVDCFKYLGSQVAADGGREIYVVHRMNEGYRAWGALKSVLRNRGLGIKAKKRLYYIRRSNCTNGVVRSRGMGYEKC